MLIRNEHYNYTKNITIRKLTGCYESAIEFKIKIVVAQLIIGKSQHGPTDIFVSVVKR